MKNYRVKAMILVPSLGAAAFCLGPLGHCVTYDFKQADLAPDLPTVAAFQETSVAAFDSAGASRTSANWLADNASGFSIFYNGPGSDLPLSVTVAPDGSIADANEASSGGALDVVLPNYLLVGANAGYLANAYVSALGQGTISASIAGAGASLPIDSSDMDSVFRDNENGGLSSASYSRGDEAGVLSVSPALAALSSTAGSGAGSGGISPLDVRERDGDLYVSSDKDTLDHVEVGDNAGGPVGPDNPAPNTYYPPVNSSSGGTPPIILQNPPGPDLGNGAGSGNPGDPTTQTSTGGNTTSSGTGGQEGQGGGLGSLTATVPDASATAVLLSLALAALAPMAWRRLSPARA